MCKTLFMDINLVLTISTILLASALIIYMIVCAKKDTSLEGATIPNREQMRYHLVWVIFYSNPEDPRGWVPKIRGYGWTVNFRKKSQIYIFCLLLILTLFSGILQGVFAVSIAFS